MPVPWQKWKCIAMQAVSIFLSMTRGSRLAEIAHSLLKLAPYDTQTMESRGLRRYIMEMLPITDWTAEAVRPALILILKRLDRMFNKIHKMPTLRWAGTLETLWGPFLMLQALKCGYVIYLNLSCCSESLQHTRKLQVFFISVSVFMLMFLLCLLVAAWLLRTKERTSKNVLHFSKRSLQIFSISLPFY